MYPDLFGIDGFSMVAMIGLGVIAAIITCFLYLKQQKVEKGVYLDVAIVAVFAILVGVIFAILTENIYEAIKASVNGQYPHWTWGMTFYGGLLGGVGMFLLLYNTYFLKRNKPIMDKILVIAPGSITIAHAFGRIGCFLSGCCYGVETDAWYGIQFPGHAHKVIPTQLIECIFLFALSAILLVMAYCNICRYTFPIYTASYGIFRFIIEFFRGDERGQLAGLSPSQYWCIVLLLITVPLYFLLSKKFFVKKEETVNDEI